MGPPLLHPQELFATSSQSLQFLTAMQTVTLAEVGACREPGFPLLSTRGSRPLPQGRDFRALMEGMLKNLHPEIRTPYGH